MRELRYKEEATRAHRVSESPQKVSREARVLVLVTLLSGVVMRLGTWWEPTSCDYGRVTARSLWPQAQ